MHSYMTRRIARGLAVMLTGVSLAACNDFLEATNPGAIEETNLNDPKYITLMANGVIGEFQPVFPWWIYYSGMFADEIRNHHVFFEERLIDQRRVTPENGTYPFFLYTPLQRARFMADSVAGRIKVISGDSAARDVRLARSLVYGGMTYVMLAENLCEIPINLSAPKPPAEIFNAAIQRFDEAVTVAAAARAAAAAITPATTASILIISSSDSIKNFALIGAARAYLNLGNKAKAIEKALLVPANFEFRSYYSLNSARENSMLFGRFSTGAGGNNTGSLNNTPFLDLKDPRVPQAAANEPLQDGSRGFPPNAPSSYSTYTGTLPGAEFSAAGHIRIASSLEAQYIIAEAQGPTAATLAFVNARRAVGGQAGGSFAGDALMAELRSQRSRDFYLDGHRLGDMRRYLAQGIDLFEKGAYPGTTSGETFGDQTCWPLPLAEINGNPNIPKP